MTDTPETDDLRQQAATLDPTQVDSVISDLFVGDNDPGNAKVELRSQISFSLRKSGDKPYVMVHDELNSQYYRLGIHEWKIAKLFDGNRTMRQVIRDATEQLGEGNVEAQEVSRLSTWLLQSGLAKVAEGSLATPSPQEQPVGQSWHDPLNQAARLGQWNPLFLKIQLPNPQRLLAALQPTLGFLFSPVFFLVWLGVCFVGVQRVCMNWDRFSSSLNDVFARENWLYLMVVWVALKVVHELGHAIACMRFGGSVTRCGLMFIVFSPIAWVDVTSAWSFRSRFQRIIVSSAGMYVEFFVAALAAIVWSQTDSPVVATHSRNIVLSASVTTLLFNLNFLMRFDGYYILTDLLDIQNLYGAGQHYLQYFNRRYLLGVSAVKPNFDGAKLWLVRIYGVAAMIWRLVFCVGILVVAAHLFRGAGIILAVLSGVLWFGIPAARLVLTLFFGRVHEKPDLFRFALICGIGIAIVGVGMVLPWPGQTLAHGVVQYSPLQPIRVNSPGFIKAIQAIPGARVSKGDVLLTLENHQLENELADLELQIKIEEISRRVAHRNNEMAEYEAINKKLESLQEQHNRVASKVATLTVEAPIDGTVIAHDLQSLEGKYVKSGTDLLAVGSTGEKEVCISIKQQDIEAFREANSNAKSRTVQISIRGHELREDRAKIERVNPRASRRVIHGALAATSGGPLAVRQASEAESESVILVDPHFEGVVRVPTSLSGDLRSGEICRVSLGRGHQRVYEKLYGFAKTYFDAKSAGSSVF